LEKEIYDLLNKNIANKTGVRLLNLYKGVPISNDAELLGLDNVFIYLKVTQYQLACIYLERGTYLQSPEFPFPLRAQLSKMDIERGDVYLTNVVKVNGGIGKRGQIRVEPQDPIWVTLQMKNALSSVTTRLADLSSTGVGVYMERFYFQPHIYRVGAELKITFDLPRLAGQTGTLVAPEIPKMSASSLGTRFGRDQLRGIMSDDSNDMKRDRQPDPREVSGHIISDALIVHFRPELYLNRYRIGLRLVNDEISRRIVNQYVSQRQSDLIREFRMVYESLIPKKRPV
jgi:hypothetical protein